MTRPDDNGSFKAGTFLKLALPMACIQASRVVGDTVDLWFLAPLGTTMQAALTPSRAVCAMLIAFGLGPPSLVMLFAARAAAMNRHFAAGSYAVQSLYFSIVYGLCLLPILALFPYLIPIIAHNPTIIQLQIDFAEVMFFSVPPMVAVFALSCYFVGVQKPVVVINALLCGNVVNALGDYLLIGGQHSFPRLGFLGAAYSTVIGAFVQLLLLFFAFLYTLRNEGALRRAIVRLHRGRLSKLLGHGVHTSTMAGVEFTMWLLFASFFVGRFDHAQMTASNIAQQLILFSTVGCSALAWALRSVLSYTIVDEEPKRNLAVIRRGTTLCLAFMLLISIMYVIFAAGLFRQFSRDPDVIGLGASLIFWIVPFNLFRGLCFPRLHTLIAAGDTKWPPLYLAGFNSLFLVPVAWIVVECFPGVGCYGPWTALVASEFLRMIALEVRYRRGAWQSIKLTV